MENNKRHLGVFSLRNTKRTFKTYTHRLLKKKMKMKRVLGRVTNKFCFMYQILTSRIRLPFNDQIKRTRPSLAPFSCRNSNIKRVSPSGTHTRYSGAFGTATISVIYADLLLLFSYLPGQGIDYPKKNTFVGVGRNYSCSAQYLKLAVAIQVTT